MRPFRLAVPLACVLAVTACGDIMPAPEAPEKAPVAKPAPKPKPAASGSAAPTNDYGATPLAERVAVLGLLNKRNNVSQDIKLKPGEAREIGPVIIRLSACERTAPWELPRETGAFVQVDIRERGQDQHTRVFSGWLFRESPSLNVVEHPVYDVWVKDCVMRFPGEEGSAKPDAADPKAKAKRPASPAAPAPAPAATPAPAAPAA